MLKKNIIFVIYFISISFLLRLSDFLMEVNKLAGFGLKLLVYTIIGLIIYKVSKRNDS
jgi:hypothetical protein